VYGPEPFWRLHDGVVAVAEGGAARILLSAPCGAGKSRLVRELVAARISMGALDASNIIVLSGTALLNRDYDWLPASQVRCLHV